MKPKSSKDAGFDREVKVTDFPKWLRENVRAEDFVVVKMDVEREEFHLIPALLKDPGTLLLVDELFLECHCIQSWHNGPHKRSECLKMFHDLQHGGVWTHEWY